MVSSIHQLFGAAVRTTRSPQLADRLYLCGKNLSRYLPARRDLLGREVETAFREFIDLANDLRIDQEKELFLEIMSGALGRFSAISRDHQKRVARTCVQIAVEYGSEIDVPNLRLAARLHDFGKMTWPRWFLALARPFNPEQIRIQQAHLYVTQAFMERIAWLRDASVIVWENHIPDGYPPGFNIDDMTIEGQILSSVDMVDGWLEARRYRDNVGGDPVEVKAGLIARHYHPEVERLVLRQMF